jgi:hypothetical protein
VLFQNWRDFVFKSPIFHKQQQQQQQQQTTTTTTTTSTIKTNSVQ